MAEGFRRAGLVFDFVFDKDPNAVNSYEKNLGHRPIAMDVRDLLRLVVGGWSPGPVELFVADPPCTPWSRAGKREGIADERDMLLDTVELIRLLRPRAYLIGNVPGLNEANNWPNLQSALAPLRKAGYCIADFATLDAANYGVPQHRVRPFWFGHLEGPCLKWPLPTHGDAEHPALPGLEQKPWVTCRDALSHLPLAELGRPVRLKRRDPKHPACPVDGPAMTVRSGGNGNAAPHLNLDAEILVNARHRPARPAPTLGAKSRVQGAEVLELDEVTVQADRPTTTTTEPSRTVTRNTHGVLLSDTRTVRPHHHTNPERPARTLTASRADDARLLDWPWARPGTTVTTRAALPPPGHHPESGSILSQPGAIVLSEKAAAILQGFPGSWVFCGDTKTTRWSQIGQAMPPPLAEAVAHCVRRQLESTK